jgi:hypothetical protein
MAALRVGRMTWSAALASSAFLHEERDFPPSHGRVVHCLLAGFLVLWGGLGPLRRAGAFRRATSPPRDVNGADDIGVIAAAAFQALKRGLGFRFPLSTRPRSGHVRSARLGDASVSCPPAAASPPRPATEPLVGRPQTRDIRRHSDGGGDMRGYERKRKAGGGEEKGSGMGKSREPLKSGIRTKKAEEKERSTSAGGTVKRQIPPASFLSTRLVQSRTEIYPVRLSVCGGRTGGRERRVARERRMEPAPVNPWEGWSFCTRERRRD